jgi:membrane-associated phospholipid phosphatase
VDYTLYRDINGLSGHALADGILKFLALNLPAILVGLVALSFLIRLSRRTERRRGAVLATASAALALLVNQPIAHLVERTRPYLAHPAHAHLLIARSHDPSFPSDHATGGFVLAFGVWLYDRTLGTVLLVLAAILAFARVYVGTHYPGDVVAGAAIGIAVAASLYLVPHTRRIVETVADRCGALWDRITTRTARRGIA